MKPGSRAEFDWSETPYPTTVMGQANSHPPSASTHPIAVLWVPDPEQRHGFREFYIYPDPKPSRPVGFRKP